MYTSGYFKGFTSGQIHMLKTGIQWVNGCLEDSSFREFFLQRNFTFTGDAPSQIFNTLNTSHCLNFRAFRPRWYHFRKKNVRAWVNKYKDPHLIHINTKIMAPKYFKSVAGTIAHEAAHLQGYGHGDNSPSTPGYNNAVPVKYGKMVRYHG